MFKKTYKVKTSTTVKASERKRLRNFAETSFPDLSQNDINSLIPNKIEMNQVKAMTHSGSVAMIYCCGQNPIFFQVEDICYPTVYTLWKFPNLLPIVTTIPPVLEKITNGADLMAPGVVTDDYIVKDMNNLKPNDICAVRIIGNKAAVAVGKALMSKDELCQEGVKGKAVSIIHCYKDNLWLSGEQIDLPILPEEESMELPEILENVNLSDTTASEDAPNEVSDSLPESDNHAAVNDLADDEVSKENEILPNYTMDEILHHSFFTTLKVTGKKITLPILTSTFYSSHVLKSCPPDLNLDIKKTTYKKLSVFLKKMQKEGLVLIKELSKGVESIVSINLENQSIKSYSIEPSFKLHLNSEKEKTVEEVPSSNIQGNYKFPLVTELYVISAQVKVLFEKYNLRKGDTIPVTTVREVLKRYAKENSLQNENNPREVILDPILSDCVAKRGECVNTMTWEQLQEVIVSKMPHAYQIEFENKDPIVKKGKLEPINVAVDTRTGNKKVTLITNLETYGINPEKLAQHVQVAVAASTSITSTQSGKGTLVLIQGNQKFIKYPENTYKD
ncbi:eukaryotic translation initiation factor 2D-like isoform X2 [Argiope bruennichi]|uniref:eukaryotic translation initiation factor 2D-like isoform X2 n=1 Tax=Argiope bruennichi TaxID=94029 RepID=UPI002493D474|nr:eukaryotic translation initiation factor 2D-like isoform X2 [Argiope bruennichi]